MLRGEIRVVDLTPARPGEGDKRRPAVIVANDAANATAARLDRGIVTVVPVTSNVERVYPFQVLLPAVDSGLDRDAKAQADQVRSVSVERVVERIGNIPVQLMLDVDEALRLHLAL